MTADVSGPSPVVDLIEHAAAIIVKAREEPHTAPGHWAGALYQAGMLVPPGHGAPAAPVDGEDDLQEQIGAAIGDPERFTKRIADDTVYEPLRDWQLRAVMAVVRAYLRGVDRWVDRLSAARADEKAIANAALAAASQEQARAERAEADLAAARKQLDQVRMIAFDPDTISALERGAIQTGSHEYGGLNRDEALGYAVDALRDIRGALDAAPAGEAVDE